MLEDGKVHASFHAPRAITGEPSVADPARSETVLAARLVGVRF